jgi:SecDF, P1 head subdomain
MNSRRFSGRNAVAGHRAANASTGALVARLANVILLGAVLCSCHSTQHPASPTTSTSTAAPPTQSVAPVVNIRPLPVRPVQKSQPTTSDKCPATDPNAPAAPTNALITCDLARTTLYALGPETMQLALTHVDSPKSLTSDFYEVNLTMDPSWATEWASFTAANLHAHIAFIRDDLVLEAPVIEEQVTSGQVALTTQTAQAADQLAQLAGRPA